MDHPAVIVHGLTDARQVLSFGAPVLLLSAPGAARYAGCLWWRELVAAARQAYPATFAPDLLDCADASGFALAALRCGLKHLVLRPEAPGWSAVDTIARENGGFILPRAPAALDMASRDARRRLHAWLRPGGP